jgi:hypothetical protein
MRHPIWVVLAMAFVADAVLASDGAFEINQACATSSAGCFPGDAGGFPVTIAAGGSYRLTSDLDLSGQSANITGIQISAQWVTLDLGGFRVHGPVACSGIPTSTCSPSGSGVGVLAGTAVTVRNGSVTGFGSDGVRVFGVSEVEGIHVFSNSGSGIVVAGGGGGALLHRNLVVSNFLYGINADVETRATDNTVVGNGFAGIAVGSGVVTGNSVSRNQFGANFGANVAFSNNTFSGNTLYSFAGGHPGAGNVCSDSKCTASGARLYYLTNAAPVNGANAASQCANGFHMASYWEIDEPSGLTYATALGLSFADSGNGPPQAGGWARTSGGKGQFNCQAYTSALASDTGIVLFMDALSVGGSLVPGPVLGIASCDSPVRVWCVQD